MPVRGAVIGLDSAFWPAAFRQAIVDHPQAELAGMCGLGLAPEVIRRDFVADVDEWLAERGDRRVDTLEEMLDIGFDAAFVCSRNTVMPDVVERLVTAGKHVFVAKPMGVTASDAARYAALTDAGVVVTGGQLARTWAPWPDLLRLVADGRVGRVVSARVVHQHGRHTDFPRELWYWDDTEGDVCTWLGWYAADAVHALLGPIAAVRGAVHGDQLAGIFELADGRHATAEVYWNVGPWGMSMHEAQIVGDEGILRHHGPVPEIQLLTDAGEERIPFMPGDGLAAEVDAFIRACSGDAEPAISITDAAHLLSVCAAWRTAASTGTTARV